MNARAVAIAVASVAAAAGCAAILGIDGDYEEVMPNTDAGTFDVADVGTDTPSGDTGPPRDAASDAADASDAGDAGTCAVENASCAIRPCCAKLFCTAGTCVPCQIKDVPCQTSQQCCAPLTCDLGVCDDP